MGALVLDSSKPPTSFILPDLVSHCKFPLTYHSNGDEIAKQSVEWLDTNCPDLNAKQRRALRGLQAGELTAFCYNSTSPERLRVVSDFMNYLFHLCVGLVINGPCAWRVWYFDLTVIILAMAWWHATPMLSQTSWWTRFGSATSTCGQMLQERNSQTMSLIPGNLQESKWRPLWSIHGLIGIRSLNFITLPSSLVSGHVAFPAVALAPKLVSKRPWNCFLKPWIFKLGHATKALSQISSLISTFAEILQVVIIIIPRTLFFGNWCFLAIDQDVSHVGRSSSSCHISYCLPYINLYNSITDML